MSGVDYEPLEHWRWDGFMGLRRKAPVRLNDRDAFGALLSKFAGYQGDRPFMLSVNEEHYDPNLPLDELVRRLPARVAVLHLQSGDGAYIVRLTSWLGGETWVEAPQKLDAGGFESPLRSLIGIIETNSKPLGWRRHLWHVRWPSKIGRYRVPVLEIATREVLAARRHDIRTAWIAGASALIVTSVVNLLTWLLQR